MRNVTLKLAQISIPIFFVAVLCVGIEKFAAGQTKKNLKFDYNPLVKVEHPQPSTVVAPLSYPGTVRASRKATLFFRVSGPVIRVQFKVGESVKKGQLLMQIDPRDFRRKISQLKSQLVASKAELKAMKSARKEDVNISLHNIDAAKSRLAKAKIDYKRYRGLARKKIATEDEYENSRNNYNIAKAELAAQEEGLVKLRAGDRKEKILAAEARLEELKTSLKIANDQLEDTRLLAPFDGVITEQLLENYEMATAGSPVVIIRNIEIIEVSVGIAERDMAYFNLKTLGDSPIRFPSISSKKYYAKLYEWVPQADPTTHTYALIFRFKQARPFRILPGMTAEVTLKNQNSKSQKIPLTIPAAALIEIKKKTGKLWVVNPKNKTAKLRQVKLGKYCAGRRIMIVEGLSQEDLIVSGGAHFINEKCKLRFLNSSSQ